MTRIQVDGRQVYYELHQPKPGADDRREICETPLLLLNGIGGSCRGWLPLQVPELSKTRATYIFDHRGSTLLAPCSVAETPAARAAFPAPTTMTS